MPTVPAVSGRELGLVLSHIERYVSPGRLLVAGAVLGSPAAAESRGWKVVGRDRWFGGNSSGEGADAALIEGSAEELVRPEVVARLAEEVRPSGVVALCVVGSRPRRRAQARERAALARAVAAGGLVATSWHPAAERDGYVLYARRAPERATICTARPARVPLDGGAAPNGDEGEVPFELADLAAATRYCDWLFASFERHVPGAQILEVGAGIGTFTSRMLETGATSMLLLEPDAACARILEERFGGDERVRITTDLLPGAPTLAAAPGTFDLVVCQNVLEHIDDDGGALQDMARALRPGGRLALIVPAGPRLYGPLDDADLHWRRYDAAAVRSVVERAGLQVEELRPMNALGVPAWWFRNRRPGARVGAGSMKAYELVVALWRPVEARVRPPIGLSLVCSAVRPA